MVKTPCMVGEFVRPAVHRFGQNAAHKRPGRPQPDQERRDPAEAKLNPLDHAQGPHGTFQFEDPKRVVRAQMTRPAQPHDQVVIETFPALIAAGEVVLMITTASTPYAGRVHDTSSR